MPKKAAQGAQDDVEEEMNTTVIRLTAGKLPESGAVLRVKGIREQTSEKFKNKSTGEDSVFWILDGTNEDGYTVELIFSSTRLHRLIEPAWDRIVGRRIKVCGFGSGMERSYSIAILKDKTAEQKEL